MSDTLNAAQIRQRLETLASLEKYAPDTTVAALQALEIGRIADAIEDGNQKFIKLAAIWNEYGIPIETKHVS